MEATMTDEIEIKIEYPFVPQDDPLASPASVNDISDGCVDDFESEKYASQTSIEPTGLPTPSTCEWTFPTNTTIIDGKFCKEENKLSFTNDVPTQKNYYAHIKGRNHDLKHEIVKNTDKDNDSNLKNEQNILDPCQKSGTALKDGPKITEKIPSIKREVVTWYKEIDNDGKLYCKFCELSYSVVQTLRYHVRTKHPTEAMLLKEAIAKASRCHKMMCHICNVKYCSLEELKDHVRLKHRIDKHENHTSKFFHMNSLNNKNNENQKDSTTKDDSRKFPCPYCAHVAKRNYGLKTHIKARHKSEQDLTYECPYCSYKASIKYYLQNHIATKHPDSEYARSKVSYLCDVCCYRTPRKSHFLEHTKSHFTTEKKHKCEYCDYSTNLIANLEVHRRTHTKEKPYLCGIDGCEYRCSAKTALNSHRLKHEPEKHFLYCDKCNYKTIYKHALKKHTESHERNMDDRMAKATCKYR